MPKKLSVNMTCEAFDAGYWYALELKAFARELGIKGASKYRKDQLEALIRQQLVGDQSASLPAKPAKPPVEADSLALDSPVKYYVSNKATKQFILQQAEILHPQLPAKSGRWYWLNRWREQQLEQNHPITYADLVQQMLHLCLQPGRLPQIPSARFNNFISDYLAAGEGTREQAMAAWQQLKKADTAKTYAAWKEQIESGE